MTSGPGAEGQLPLPLDGRSLCIVGVNYAPETTGIAPYTTAMARHLVARGADVVMVTGVPYYPQHQVPEYYRDGRTWREIDHGVKVLRRRQAVPESSGLKGRAVFESSWLAAAAPAAARVSADAYLAVTPSLSGLAAAVYASRVRRRPLGVVVQDLVGNGATESGTAGAGAGRVIGGAEYGLLRRASAVGVITPRFGEILEANGVPAERIVLLPNFTHITSSSATVQEARAALGWPLDRPLAVHTGNMGMKQGLETVVDAARLAEGSGLGFDVLLVGDGNQRQHLETYAAGVRNVRFVDPLDDEKYPLALAAADVLLLNERPSVAEMSLPSKLTSYLAAGRPIVAAVASGGITEQAARRSGACEVVEAGSAEQIVAAIGRIVADRDLADSLAAAGPRYAEQHLSAAAAMARYEEFVGRLWEG